MLLHFTLRIIEMERKQGKRAMIEEGEHFMSMDIHYEAKRPTPLSAGEKTAIDEITQKYWQEYPRKDEYEGPGFFNTEGEEDIVYLGLLRMPLEFMHEGPEGMEGFEDMEEFLNYWLKWLTDVTRALPDAEWNVEFEDIPLIWHEENGWQMMSDEEFAAFGLA